MSEQLKTIVAVLNKAPFNHSYNLITFDALKNDQILQILNDVLAEIDPKQVGDIREEEPDQMALRMFGTLRILKYPTPGNPSEFLQGLVKGEKHVIYPILEWLLRRVPELKKRAYLARYLVKVDIPMEIVADVDVGELYNQYELLIEQFKEVHKECENLKRSGFSTGEMRKDIENMEAEREVMLQRIERMKHKVEGAPNHLAMLTVAKNLRIERERERELSGQEEDQTSAVSHAEQRIQRLQGTLKSLRQAGLGATPEGLMQKLEEEVRVNTYIVEEKLPRELAQKKIGVETMQRVAAEPAMGQNELQNIKSKIAQVQAQIQSAQERKLTDNDPKDDELTHFRQRAAVIARKKDAAAEKLNELRSEKATIEEDIKEKNSQMAALGNETLIRGEDFKEYVNKLRGKSSIYKTKKTELSELRSEFGVLSRTEEILKQRNENILQALATMEAREGVSGFRGTQERLEQLSQAKSGLDEAKGKTLEEMSDLVLQLNTKIADRKAHLAPIIKELRPLRNQVGDLTVEYEEKKHAYDSMTAGLESNVARIEQEVNDLEEKLFNYESQYHRLQAETQIFMLHKERVGNEVKKYLTPGDKKSIREELMEKILEAEKVGKQLKEEQKNLKDTHPGTSRQKQIWNDLLRMMECKRECFELTRGGSSQFTRGREGEALIL